MNGAASFDDLHNLSNNNANATDATAINERVIAVVAPPPDAVTSSSSSSFKWSPEAAGGDHASKAGAAKKIACDTASGDDAAVAMAMDMVMATDDLTAEAASGAPPELLRWVTFDESSSGPASQLPPPPPPSPPPPPPAAAAPASAAAAPLVPHPAAREGGDNLVPSPRTAGAQFTENDVLCGRGGLGNNNPGNKKFMRHVRQKRPEYVAAQGKRQKALVVQQVIHEWRTQDPPGRFLQLDARTKSWIDASPDKVKVKVSQALRDAGRGSGGAGNYDDDEFEPYPIDRDVDPEGGVGVAWDPALVAQLLLVTSGDDDDQDDQDGDDLVEEDEAEPEPPAAGAPPGGTSVQAQIKPRAQRDCVLGSEGQSDSIEGTREFWELASRDKARYRSCADPTEMKLLARNLVCTWHARHGRFLQCAKVTKTRTCSWTVATESDAVAMVHRFMGHDWVISKDEDLDYLFGKGGEVINHPGSKRFRATMDAVRPSYIASGLEDAMKRDVARGVIQAWRAQGGRFLHKDKTIGLWHEVDDSKILTMVQTYLSRDKERHRAQLQQQQIQLPPSPVVSATSPSSGHGRRPTTVSSSFAQSAYPAYTSCGVPDGIVGSSSSGSASTAHHPPTRRRMAALASRAGRLLLAPLLCLFGRGRHSKQRPT